MTPLLALHGFTGSPQSWDFLSATHPSAIVPALLGHDGSDAQHGVLDFEGEIERLLSFAPARQGVHVIGYSLGARLALGLTLLHPERVQRLTLVSGQPGLGSQVLRRARREQERVADMANVANGSVYEMAACTRS